MQGRIEECNVQTIQPRTGPKFMGPTPRKAAEW